MKNFKGISTLITTILIIVVSVILVTVLLAWGRNFTNNSVNKADDLLNQKCDTATLHISECSITSDGNIILQIKNTSKNYSFTASIFSMPPIYSTKQEGTEIDPSSFW